VKFTKTYLAKAGVDLSGSEGYFVKHDSGANLAADPLISGGEKHIGVIDQGGGNTAGLPVTVVICGPVNCIAGEAIAIGDMISVTAAGKAQVAAEAEFINGRALEAAGGDGKMFLAFVHPPVPYVQDT
jgi:hypothetical protein